MTAEPLSVEPRRIQRRRTKGWRMPENAVYVGRPTRWGNPFFTAELFKEWLTAPEVSGGLSHLAYLRGYLLGSLPELRGKDLACWCPLGQPCHADVLLRIANTPASSGGGE